MDSAEIFAAVSGVPDWENNGFRVTVPLDKWPKLELKVHMCCKKCEEIVEEEIWEVNGVVAVKTDRLASKVTVTGCPNSSSVLKKARKVDKKATILVISKAQKEKEKPKKKEEDSATTSSAAYRLSQDYPPRYHTAYPERDYSPILLPNPHYLKHVVYYT